MRTANVSRKTKETDITVTVNIDGRGDADVSTGVGFFDHMLAAFAKFGRFDISVTCDGDLSVDAHHTVEDVGLCLGDAFARACADKAGVTRAAHAYVPMDEALAFVALDLSGRGMMAMATPLPSEMIGSFNARLAEEFFRAFAMRGGATMHMSVTCAAGYSGNAHHMVEALFKAAGMALGLAVLRDPRITGIIPSTKGVI